MTTETPTSDDEAQAAHAQLFGATARQLMQAAFDFAAGVHPKLTMTDVGLIYLAAGAHLALRDSAPATVATKLRALADSIEAGAPIVN